jgi:hypothetical protein
MTKGDSDGNRLFSFLLHARREVSAATRDRQHLGAPHQKHREQRRRRGNRSRQQRRSSESIGTSVPWPVGLGGQGNGGVARLVKETPFPSDMLSLLTP